MNEVIITMKCGNIIRMIVEEDQSHEDIAKKVSSLFSMTNIAITSSKKTSIVLRPSDISTVQVSPIKEEINQSEESNLKDKTEIVSDVEEETPVKEKEEIVEDIITDYEEEG